MGRKQGSFVATRNYEFCILDVSVLVEITLLHDGLHFAYFDHYIKLLLKLHNKLFELDLTIFLLIQGIVDHFQISHLFFADARLGHMQESTSLNLEAQSESSHVGECLCYKVST